MTVAARRRPRRADRHAMPRPVPVLPGRAHPARPRARRGRRRSGAGHHRRRRRRRPGGGRPQHLPRSRPTRCRSCRTSSAAPGTPPRSRWPPCAGPRPAPCSWSTATPRCCAAETLRRAGRRAPRSAGAVAHRAHRRGRRPDRLRPDRPRRRRRRSPRSSSRRTPTADAAGDPRDQRRRLRLRRRRAAPTRWPASHRQRAGRAVPDRRRRHRCAPTAAGRRASWPPTPSETEGVNDRVQLADGRGAQRAGVLDGWMRAGVTVVDPATTWIDVDVELGAGRRAPARHPAARRDRRSAPAPSSARTPR